MNDGKWDARIRRAAELSSAYPYAAQGLRFYAQVATLQRNLYTEFLHSSTKPARSIPAPSLQDKINLPLLLSRFRKFLEAIEQVAPEPLAQTAAALAESGAVNWQKQLEDFWHSGMLRMQEEAHDSCAPSETLLAWIFLQPYAEYLAIRHGPAALDGTPSICPLCGARPIVGVLRPEGDGAKKSLICMLCAHEWAFRRIYCPACGEEREPQMAFYSAPEIAHVRVDVCDTCHTYLKSVDLTKAGLAVPVVDELATIPLDLWAREHGYTKLQMNLLGT
jgi:FdhE protein